MMKYGLFTLLFAFVLSCLLATPAFAGLKTWDGSTGDGLASTAGNWTPSGAPGSADDILLDSTSSSNLTWDSSATHTVNSWTQTVDYAGTVTVYTTYADYDTTFTNFTVSADCVISNGGWTHADNAAEERYRLDLTVGNNFTLGSTAMLDAMGRGYDTDNGPGNPDSGGYKNSASHGGLGSAGTVYGSITSPARCGSGGDGYNQSRDVPGGGAIRIEVGGKTTLTAGSVITADAFHSADSGEAGGMGSGGSVYLRTGSIEGSGTVSADGGNDEWNGRAGAGGRVAVVLTGAAETFDNLTLGNLHAYGGSGNDDKLTSAGTVYLEADGDLDGQGSLLIKNNNMFPDLSAQRSRNYTLMPSGTVLSDFAEVSISEKGALAIDSGTTVDWSALNLTGAGKDSAYFVIMDDANVTYPATLTVSNFTLYCDGISKTLGNLTVVNGGLTHTPNGGTINYYLDLNISGALTIASTGEINVDGRGYGINSGPGAPGYSGTDDWSGSHGGQGKNVGDGQTYGSILAPTNAGSGGSLASGGGLVILSVAGNTDIDGVISAVGASHDGGGAGGTVYITTGSFDGTGEITADGSPPDSNVSHTGGAGRIAVLITGAGETFAGFTGEFSAHSQRNKDVRGSAAGTIYLQEGDDADGAGTVTIDNGGNDENIVFTHLPPQTDFDDDLSGTSFVTANAAKLRLTDNIKIGAMTVQSGTLLDLAGYTLTLADPFVLDSQTYKAGKYTAADFTADGHTEVTNSVGTGYIVVPAKGTVFSLR
ncbi:MAG: hypothetical protein R6V03_09200 [Kiritimatiellia bacterium]